MLFRSLPTYTAERGLAPGVSVVPEAAATLCTRASPLDRACPRGALGAATLHWAANTTDHEGRGLGANAHQQAPQ